MTAFSATLASTARIVFLPPRVAIGGLTFEITGASAQPPVDLCTTYLDERVRLGLASRGGRFVFRRGGKADEPFADEWKELCERRLTDGRLALGCFGLTVGACVLRPSLAAHLGFGAVGVGLGWGGTKVLRSAVTRLRGTAAEGE